MNCQQFGLDSSRAQLLFNAVRMRRNKDPIFSTRVLCVRKLVWTGDYRVEAFATGRRITKPFLRADKAIKVTSELRKSKDQERAAAT